MRMFFVFYNLLPTSPTRGRDGRSSLPFPAKQFILIFNFHFVSFYRFLFLLYKTIIILYNSKQCLPPSFFVLIKEYLGKTFTWNIWLRNINQKKDWYYFQRFSYSTSREECPPANSFPSGKRMVHTVVQWRWLAEGKEYHMSDSSDIVQA